MKKAISDQHVWMMMNSKSSVSTKGAMAYVTTKLISD